MKRCAYPLFAALTGLFCGCFYIALLEAYFGMPTARELQGAWGLWWHLDFYEGVWAIAVLLCLLAMFTAWVAAYEKSYKFVLGAGAVVSAVGVIVHYSNPPIPTLFLRPGPRTPVAWEILLYLTISGIFVLCGLVSGRLWRHALSKEGPPKEKPSSQPKHHGRLNLGFSLVELLVVIMILSILAAILLPVLARSKRAAYGSVDRAQLEQVYIAVNLYEQDNNDKSPENLAKVIPQYAPPSVFYTHIDPRGVGKGNVWPVNLFLQPIVDGPSALVSSKYPISFAYLRAFSQRFHPGDTWDIYRNDPKVGMLVDTTIAYQGEPRYFSANPLPNEPAYNFQRFLVCRMDGSITERVVPDGCTGEYYEAMFLFWSMNCKTGPVGVGS